MFLAWRAKADEYVDPFANQNIPKRKIGFEEKSSTSARIYYFSPPRFGRIVLFCDADYFFL